MNVPANSLPELDTIPDLEQDPVLSLTELVEPLAEEPVEVPEQEQSVLETGEAPAEASTETTPEQKIQFSLEGQLYEATPEQVAEFVKGYMRQDEYTRRVQHLRDHEKKEQYEKQALYELNKFMQNNPAEGKVIYDLLFGDGNEVRKYVERRFPNATPQQTDKMVSDLLDQTQTPNQQNVVDPRLAQLEQQQLQIAQYLYGEQQRREQYRALKQEEAKLDQRLNQVRQKYGDAYNEQNILKWMLHLNTNDPEYAVMRMYQYAQQQAQQKPLLQPVQPQQQIQQQVPMVEAGKLGGPRGVAANSKNTRPSNKPRKKESYEQVGLRMIQELGN